MTPSQKWEDVNLFYEKEKERYERMKREREREKKSGGEIERENYGAKEDEKGMT